MSYFPVDPGDSLEVSVIDINDAFDATARWFQGESAPSSPSTFQKWVKPSTGVVSFREETNASWVPWLHADVPTGVYFSDGADHILVKAPADVATSGYTLVLPAAQGANNQYLRNDGSGNLTWVTLGAGVTALDDLSDVVITAGASGDYLRHNGTNWVDHAGVLVGDLSVASQANGDLIVRTGGAWTRLGIGSNGQVLSVVSGAVAWAAGGGGAGTLNDLTDVVITAAASGEYLRHNGTNWVDHAGVLVGDLTVASAAQGDLIVRGASTFGRLAIGTNGQVLSSNGTTAVWADPTGGGAVDLDDLTDVTLGSLAAGEYLRFNGSGWGDSPLLLTDLTVGSQANGDLAYYNGTTWTRLARGTDGQFLRSTTTTVAWQTVALGATSLDGLSDVSIIGSPATGEVIRFGGVDFRNARILATDLGEGGTARGALIRRAASGWETVALGSNGQVLSSNGTDAIWANPSAGAFNDLTDVTLTGVSAGDYVRYSGAAWVNVPGIEVADLMDESETRGDVIVMGDSGWIRLPLGDSGFVLTSDGTDVVWAEVSGGGGGNSFTTINCPSGTDPVADSSADTLNLAAGTGVTITGDSSTDTVTLGLSLGAIDHDALLNFSANEHSDRTGTVSVTGTWSFDRTNASDIWTEFSNPGTGTHGVRVDGALGMKNGSFTGKLLPNTLGGDRTWNLPDTTGEITVAGNTFTGSGSVVRASSPTIASLTVDTGLAIAALGTLTFAATGGNIAFDVVNTLGQNTVVTIPDPGETGTTLIFSHGAAFDETITLKAGVEIVVIRDGFNHSIGVVGSTSAARSWDFPNVSGEITVLGNAATGTGDIVRAASPTLTGTAIANAISCSSLQTGALLLKELTGADTVNLTCAATAASYTINFPSSGTLPPSGTYYVKIDSSGNLLFAAS